MTASDWNKMTAEQLQQKGIRADEAWYNDKTHMVHIGPSPDSAQFWRMNDRGEWEPAGKPSYDGGPAFPQACPEMCIPGQTDRETQGMTLRDWFAGMALQGIIASMANLSIPTALKMLEDVGGQDNLARIVAESASKYADAMIVAQKGEPQP